MQSVYSDYKGNKPEIGHRKTPGKNKEVPVKFSVFTITRGKLKEKKTERHVMYPLNNY